MKVVCPGQDTRFWKPDDISESPCSVCGKPVEFFKDDLRRRCPHCDEYTVNPKNDMACFAWCKEAKKCMEQLGTIMPEEECEKKMRPKD